MKLIAFVVAITISMVIAASDEHPLFRELPPLCEEVSPNYNDCMLKLLEKAKPVVLRGIPTLNFPKLSPLKIKDFSVQHDFTDSIGFAVNFRNVETSGFEKFKFLKYNLDSRGNRVDVFVEIPSLELNVDYNVNAKALGRSISNEGNFHIKTGKLSKIFELQYAKTRRNGRDNHISVEVTNDDFKMDDLIITVTTNNPAYQTAINGQLQEYNNNRLAIINVIQKVFGKCIANLGQIIIESLINGISLPKMAFFDN